MKNRKDYFVLLDVIIYIAFVAIVNFILQNNYWYLRSWVYKCSVIIIHIAIFMFLILRLRHNNSKKKKIIIIIIFILFIGISFFDYILSSWIIKIDKIKEIDDTKYVGVEYLTNRLRKSIYYYKDYNFFAYHKTKEYVEEFYDYKNYEQPETRTYRKIPITESIVYYYDGQGNIINMKSYNEKGSIVDYNEDTEIKKQYNVEFGNICEIKNNELKIGFYKQDESSLKTIELTSAITVIDYETEKEISYSDIEIGDYAYIHIPTENNENKQTIITIAKKNYIEKKAIEVLKGKKKIDTSLIYYNSHENYVIAKIQISKKEINNFFSNACCYIRFNILPTTEIYLARTESYKDKSDILLNELCWITIDAPTIANLNNDYNATIIEFFGD